MLLPCLRVDALWQLVALGHCVAKKLSGRWDVVSITLYCKQEPL